MTNRVRKKETSEDIIRDVVKPIETNFDGLDRINSFENYSKKINKTFLEDTTLKYTLMDARKLVKASSDKHMTMLEKQILNQLQMSVGKGKMALQAIQMLHERIAGKAVSRLEHSGPDGEPITLSNSKLVENLDDMSLKELRKIKRAVKIVKSVNAAHNETE